MTLSWMLNTRFQLSIMKTSFMVCNGASQGYFLILHSRFSPFIYNFTLQSLDILNSLQLPKHVFLICLCVLASSAQQFFSTPKNCDTFFFLKMGRFPLGSIKFPKFNLSFVTHQLSEHVQIAQSVSISQFLQVSNGETIVSERVPTQRYVLFTQFQVFQEAWNRRSKGHA